MAWTIDGTPILTRAHTEKVYAYRAVEALNPEVPTRAALSTLRALLDASRAIGTDPLALAIVTALGLRREVATGTPPTTSVDDAVGTFDRWLLVELPEMRSSW